MKKLFIIFCMCVIANSALCGQVTVERNYSRAVCPEILVADVSNEFFVIRFEYNDAVYMRPSTFPEGVPHWDAKINIFKIVNGKRIQVGKEFTGYFTDDKCWEDSSFLLTKKAEDLEPKDLESKIVSGTNTINDYQIFVTNNFIDNIMGVATNYSCAITNISQIDSIRNQKEGYTNLIKQLVSEGDVCNIIGHKWKMVPYITTFYTEILERKCSLCDKTQIKLPGEWK